MSPSSASYPRQLWVWGFRSVFWPVGSMALNEESCLARGPRGFYVRAVFRPTFAKERSHQAFAPAIVIAVSCLLVLGSCASGHEIGRNPSPLRPVRTQARATPTRSNAALLRASELARVPAETLGPYVGARDDARVAVWFLASKVGARG